MQTIGFVISSKQDEERRALLPKDVFRLRHPNMLVFEEGYGEVLGISDQAYKDTGARVCSCEEAHAQPVVCNPKVPTLEEREYYRDGQTFFGWVHAVQGKSIVDFFTSKKMCAIAWEEMYEKDRYIFWRNREISGEAAILHALPFLNQLPDDLQVAMIGRGNCARGAFKILSRLGANVRSYDRVTVKYLREEIGEFDVIVNAVLWDVFRTDHLVYREDLKKMKPGSMIIDISCDEGMGIETSRPTTIKEPIYVVDGVLHYAVDHTPSIFAKSASEAISTALSPYIDCLVEERPNPVLEQAMCIRNGVILDQRVIEFQNRTSTNEVCHPMTEIIL